MYSEADKAYLAGFLDGEGSIIIDDHGGKSRLSVRVVLGNTHVGVLQELQSIWGGFFYTKQAQKEGWKQGSVLEWATKEAVELLREIQPYLRIKKEQCQVALKFQETINSMAHRTKPIPLEVQSYRLELRDIMRELNHKGTRCNPKG